MKNILRSRRTTGRAQRITLISRITHTDRQTGNRQTDRHTHTHTHARATLSHQLRKYFPRNADLRKCKTKEKAP